MAVNNWFMVAVGVFIVSLLGGGVYHMWLEYKLSKQKREIFNSLKPYSQEVSKRIQESGLDLQEMNMMLNLELKDIKRQLAKERFSTKGKFEDKIPKSRLKSVQNKQTDDQKTT